MSIAWNRVGIKVAPLLPFVVALTLFAAIHLLTYAHLEEEYTEEYVDASFLSAQRVFNTAVRINTDRLSATLSNISRDDGIKQAMIAGDRKALLRLAKPVLESRRKEYGVTHLYFIRPDRSVFLRVHQPDSYDDVINRVTVKQAQASGKLEAGLELGPAGTFTLRTVMPLRDGGRLIGYIELGEELGSMLGSLRDMLGIDLFVTIDKRYLSQQDWAHGIAMLGRQEEWDFLPDRVIIFQTMQKTSTAIRKVLGQKDFPLHADGEISDQESKFHMGHMPLREAGGRQVGNVLLLRDVTARSEHSRRDIMLAGGVAFVVGGMLLWLFYLEIGGKKLMQAKMREITTREQNKQELTHLHRLQEQILDSIGEGIHGIDLEGNVIFENPAAVAMLGWTQQELVGRSAHAMMHHTRADGSLYPSSDCLIYATLRSGSTCHVEDEVFWRKDGTSFHVAYTSTPMRNEVGEVEGAIVSFSDITARKRDEQVLAASQRDLQNAYDRIVLK